MMQKFNVFLGLSRIKKIKIVRGWTFSLHTSFYGPLLKRQAQVSVSRDLTSQALSLGLPKEPRVVDILVINLFVLIGISQNFYNSALI